MTRNSFRVIGTIGLATLAASATLSSATSPPMVMISPSSSIVIDVSPPGLEGFGPLTVSYELPGHTFSHSAISPFIVDNLSITGPSTGPLTVVGSGFTYQDIGSYNITFFATDVAGGVGSNALTITVVPKPTTATLFAAGLFAARRRRQA